MLFSLKSHRLVSSEKELRSNQFSKNFVYIVIYLDFFIACAKMHWNIDFNNGGLTSQYSKVLGVTKASIFSSNINVY